jgi:hypothetical protein
MPYDYIPAGIGDTPGTWPFTAPGFLTADQLRSLWYKYYGFNSEQEFDSFWQRYGSKIRLKWLQAPAPNFATYQEYQQWVQRHTNLANIKWTFYRALLNPPTWSDPNYVDASTAYQPAIMVKTTDGRTWNFWLPRQGGQGGVAVNGDVRSTQWKGIHPQRVLYNILRLASSSLVTSIDVLPSMPKYAYYPEHFELFTNWIASGRIPITLTGLSGVPPVEQPSFTPPPVSAPPVTTPPTTTPPTTTPPTAGETPPTPPSIGGPGATPSAKSILPYVAIGAGALVLLVLLMRK